MTGIPDERSDPILEEALDWWLRIQAAPDDGQLRSAFDAWLAADAVHGEAWDRVRNAWQLIGDVPPVHGERWAGHGRGPVRTERTCRNQETSRSWRDGHRSSGPARRLGVGLTAAALTICLGIFVLPSAHLWVVADHLTAVGENRKVMLEDGTTVHLNTDSAITTGYSHDSRNVVLLNGEAFFQVIADHQRRFSVSAGEFAVSVTGTAFDVRLAREAFTVSVASGAVAVHYERGGQPMELNLRPGERLRVDRATGATELTTIRPRDVASWRDGQLFVQDATIAEVVAELRRYYKGYMLITDDGLAANRVTGLYNLRDPYLALRALVEPHAGTVRTVTPYLFVLSPR